jgi:small GTP-binding protein
VTAPAAATGSTARPLIVHATAVQPGAIAIIHLIGPSDDVLRELTGVDDWPPHKLRFVNFSGIDEGLAVRLRDDVVQIMPHGGIRVVQRITAKLIELGAIVATDAETTLDPQQTFPETEDRVEALMLATLARAQSPLAIDLLLDQPRRWREHFKLGNTLSDEDRSRSTRLNRLIDPPIVVLAGRPNVGKSSLSNALIGRALSISYDMPGTTRDYTAGRIILAGLVVDWHDTPGIRATDDAIERKAIELARQLIERADLLIALRDPQTDWPQLLREPDLRAINKIDAAGDGFAEPSGAVRISAQTGEGLAAFVATARDALVPPNDLLHAGPWLFDQRLLELNLVDDDKKTFSHS